MLFNTAGMRYERRTIASPLYKILDVRKVRQQLQHRVGRRKVDGHLLYGRTKAIDRLLSQIGGGMRVVYYEVILWN